MLIYQFQSVFGNSLKNIPLALFVEARPNFPVEPTICFDCKARNGVEMKLRRDRGYRISPHTR